MIDLPLNYARVLYDMNIDPENLSTARSLLTESPELVEALVNPLVRRSEKRNIIEKLFPESLWNFLKVMSDNGERRMCFRDGSTAYDGIVREKENTVEAVFTYVTKPDDAQIRKPEGKNRQRLGKEKREAAPAGRSGDHRRLHSHGRRTGL